MRRNARLFRLTANVALTALLWRQVLPVAAVAQPAPPPLPLPYQAQPAQPQGDPPSRVGRISGIAGTVSLHGQGETQWSPARVNYPVSGGYAFWTEPAAEAQLEIAGSRIVLANTTELDIATLDNTGLQAVVAQGETYIHLRHLAANETWSIQTPRGLVRFNGEGRYAIAAGTTEQPTLITAIDGSAQVDGPDVSLRIGSGETASIDGTSSFAGSVGPVRRDAFLTAQLDAERPPPTSSVPVPAQVAVMPGGSDLVRYGDWSEAPEYGRVWYPPVSQGWVPYREGHWAYVAPWGWTWIDDAPWGFAPFHYGRWISIDGRWAWAPGGSPPGGYPAGAYAAGGYAPGGYAAFEPPVYAPALVTFIGIGAGVALGAALASGSIGWVPLGPREPYRPWYRTSDRYRQAVNIQNVTNINNNTVNNNIVNNVTNNSFVNRAAATAIPNAAMAGSRPVQSVAQPVSAQQFATARPIVGQQPIRPNIATSGVTPAVARQMNLGSAAALRAAPGPALRTQVPGPIIHGSALPRPALLGPAASGSAIPGSATAGSATPASAVQGPATPGSATSGPAISGVARSPLPPARAQSGIGGIPAVQPGRPAGVNPAPVPNPPAANAGAIPAPLLKRPPPLLSAAVQPAQPGVVAPGGNLSAPPPSAIAKPALPSVAQPAPPGTVGPNRNILASPPPVIRPVPPASPPAMAARPVPQVLMPARPEASHFAAPAPRPEPQHLAPAAPPPHVVTPSAAPRFEPPHFAAPAPVPRPEPPRMPAPAPRAAPPPPVQMRAAPAPAAHEKRPGER